MQLVDTYKFWTKQPWEKRLSLTRYRMTIEEAAKRHPGAEPDLKGANCAIRPPEATSAARAPLITHSETMTASDDA